MINKILSEYDKERHMKIVQKNSEERGRKQGAKKAVVKDAVKLTC